MLLEFQLGVSFWLKLQAISWVNAPCKCIFIKKKNNTKHLMRKDVCNPNMRCMPVIDYINLAFNFLFYSVTVSITDWSLSGVSCFQF